MVLQKFEKASTPHGIRGIEFPAKIRYVKLIIQVSQMLNLLGYKVLRF